MLCELGGDVGSVAWVGKVRGVGSFSGSVGCVNTSSGSLSLFRDRCVVAGNISCGSCIIVSRGVTIVSAISTEGAGR